MELVISLAASGILAAGLVSSLYVSTGALNTLGSSAQRDHAAHQALQRLAKDVHLATSFSERTTRAITVQVPDRDGDNAAETIRYAWSGVAGDPLVYTYNGVQVNLAEDVQSFQLAGLTRAMLAGSPDLGISSGVVYEEFTEAKLASSGISLSINTPAAYAEGDLLVAAVVTDGKTLSGFGTPSGWTLLHLSESTGSSTNAITFGVWWKFASASEASSHTFSWGTSKQAYGWIMRFTGHDPTSPIHVSAQQVGTYVKPIPSPAVSTTLENCLILRAAGIDGKSIVVDSSGVADYTTITMDASNTSSLSACCGGAAYATFAGTGDTGASSFTVNTNEDYVSVTIAIAPEVQ